MASSSENDISKSETSNETVVNFQLTTPEEPIDLKSTRRLTLVNIPPQDYPDQTSKDFSVAADVVIGKNKEGKLYSFASHFIADMVGDDPQDDERIEIKGVPADILEKIVEFMEYHATHEMKPIKRPLELLACAFDEYISEYLRNLFNEIGMEGLLRMTETANYMNIEYLTQVTHGKIISMLKNKKKQEVLEILAPFKDIPRPKRGLSA